MNNPSTLIFLGLAVVWAIVLLPEGIKKLSKARRSDSIRSFNHQLSVLDRSGSSRRPAATRRSATRPAVPSANVIDLRDRRPAAQRPVGQRSVAQRPMAQGQARVPASVKRRRQEVTAGLAAVAVLSLLCLIAFGSAFLWVHLVSVALLVGYLFLVSQANRNATTPQGLGSQSFGSQRSGSRSVHYSHRGAAVGGLRTVSPLVDSRSARRSI